MIKTIFEVVLNRGLARRLLPAFSLIISAIVLSACAEPVSTVKVVDGESSIALAAPAILLSRAVNADNLVPEISVNGDRLDLVNSGDVWTGDTQVAVNDNVNVEVKWFELYKGEKLLLAVANESENGVKANTAFDIRSEDYVFTGEGMDNDGDSINNITERRQDTDPLDANSPGNNNDVEPMVKIPASKKANTVDAQFNALFWNNAQFLDTQGETLLIDNLIVEESGNAVVGSPNYQWAAIHDEQYLSIFIFGKEINPVEGVSATRDSGVLWFNDDSVEIFWDGNLSRLKDYDSDDDMHIMIPLVRGEGETAQANKSGESDSLIKRGANVSALVDFDIEQVEFASCLCQGERVTWEIKIDLAEAQIPIGKTFGFEIQINQDDDGGERDSKWAWALPAREPGKSNVETDITWRFPNRMGLIKLLPFPG